MISRHVVEGGSLIVVRGKAIARLWGAIAPQNLKKSWPPKFKKIILYYV